MGEMTLSYLVCCRDEICFTWSKFVLGLGPLSLANVNLLHALIYIYQTRNGVIVTSKYVFKFPFAGY